VHGFNGSWREAVFRDPIKPQPSLPANAQTSGATIMLPSSKPVRSLTSLTNRLLAVDPPSRVKLVRKWIEQSGLDHRDIETLVGALRTGFADLLRLPGESPDLERCSFCHRSQRDVRILVSATEAAICDECVVIASQTIATPRGPRGAPDRGMPRSKGG